MTQADGDGLPTMGQQAEADLQTETQFRCTCGQPDVPGVMHRTDGPCTVPTERQKLDEMMDANTKAPNPQTGSQGEPEWLSRLKIEHHDLDQKGMALHRFIRSDPRFLKLPDRDQTLLKQQMETMGVYYAILNERLFRANNPAIAAQADAEALRREQEDAKRSSESLQKAGLQ